MWTKHPYSSSIRHASSSLASQAEKINRTVDEFLEQVAAA
jgi:hypothetical protein